jgi:hypothetical protein
MLDRNFLKAVWTCSVDGVTPKQVWNTTDGTLTDGDGTSIAEPPKYRHVEICNCDSALRLRYMVRKSTASGSTLRVSSTRYFSLAPDETRVFKDIDPNVEITIMNNSGTTTTSNVTVIALG